MFVYKLFLRTRISMITAEENLIIFRIRDDNDNTFAQGISVLTIPRKLVVILV